jgi:hypothetical protein
MFFVEVHDRVGGSAHLDAAMRDAASPVLDGPHR